MVEFGLKLEDNKVEDWKDKYIDYEKLKRLIEEAKVASRLRSELEAQRPEISKGIKDGIFNGSSDQNDYMSDTSLSTKNLNMMGQRAVSPPTVINPGSDENRMLLSGNNSFGEIKSYGRSSPDEFGEDGVSVKMKDKNYGSVSDTNIAGYLKRTMSGIFQKKSFKKKFVIALEEETKAINMFTDFIHGEVEKVKSFYNDKLEELQNRLEHLVSETNGSNLGFKSEDRKKRTSFQLIRRHVPKRISIAGVESDDDIEGLSNSNRQNRLREVESIQRALVDLYRRTKLLNNYAIMNMTGFVKIIKKFYKTLPECKGKFDEISVSNKSLEGEEAERLSDRMEHLYANWFCDKNMIEARAKMLSKKGDGLEMDWSQLRLGYRLGMCSVLAIWVCWDCIWGLMVEGKSTIGGRTAFPVFRAVGGLILLHWFWGFSVYTWSRYRINYIFLFDFDPRIVNSPIKILNDATDETLVFLIFMLLYYKSGAQDIPDIFRPGMYPLILVLYMSSKLFFPWKQRKGLWKAIGSVVTAPLSSPSFFHTYVADVFTSMVKIFQDIVWTICFIASGDFLKSEFETDDEPHLWQHRVWYRNIVIPIICLFPLLIRFNQCLRRYIDTGKRWPNLANAFKYALSQTVTLFGAFHPLYLLINHKKIDIHVDNDDSLSSSSTLFNQTTEIDLFQTFWMGVFIASTLYSFTWDVYMDWGLGRPKFSFLGPRLMFPKTLHYYGVICLDLVLRMMWVLTLIPPQSGAKFAIPSYLNAATMSLELLRRTLWGFFRLENEHRNNTEGLRRVSFVPLHFATGHSHKYDKQKRHSGRKVIIEVAAITAIVISICTASVIAAQRASHSNLI